MRLHRWHRFSAPTYLERLHGGSQARGFAVSRRPPASWPRVRARRPRPGVLAQHGDNASAIVALDQALTISAHVGANWDVARIRGRLRRLGVRRRPARTGRPKTGWEALTEAEFTVANLAARGCT